MKYIELENVEMVNIVTMVENSLLEKFSRGDVVIGCCDNYYGFGRELEVMIQPNDAYVYIVGDELHIEEIGEYKYLIKVCDIHTFNKKEVKSFLLKKLKMDKDNELIDEILEEIELQISLQNK